MIEWSRTLSWEDHFLLYFLVWLAWLALRPLRDYYILQRLYFDRLHENPWRGKLFAAHYEGFDNYQAAKVVFDDWEANAFNMLDNGAQEAVHNLFIVPARSKGAAIGRLKPGKANDLLQACSLNSQPTQLLHTTPTTVIHNRRSYWEKVAKEAAEQPEQ